MNFKGILYILLFVAMGSVTLAQTAPAPLPPEDTVPKTSGYFSFGIGGSVPMGSFSSVTSGNLGSYATPGLSAYLSAAIMLKKLKFGFAIKEGWYTCGFNSTKYLSSVQASDSVHGRTYAQQGGGNKYNGGYGLVGIITDIHIKKSILEFRVMGGRLTAVFPEVTYSVTGPGMTTSPTYDFSSSEAQSFAFEAGISTRIPFSKYFGFMADIGYIYSSFAYGTSEQYTDGLGVQQTAGAYSNCTVSFFSGTVGLAYIF